MKECRSRTRTLSLLPKFCLISGSAISRGRLLRAWFRATPGLGPGEGRGRTAGGPSGLSDSVFSLRPWTLETSFRDSVSAFARGNFVCSKAFGGTAGGCAWKPSTKTKQNANCWQQINNPKWNFLSLSFERFLFRRRVYRLVSQCTLSCGLIRNLRLL